MMNKTQIFLLLTFYCLGLTELVLTQSADINDDLGQIVNTEATTTDANSADVEQKQMLALSILLAKGLNDNAQDKTAIKTTANPMKIMKIKLKKPSRKIKGPKLNNKANEESEESEESMEEDNEHEEHEDVVDEDDDDEEDPAEDFEYNPWKHQFHDIFPDGTYVYGYSLPHGSRRYERSSQSINGLVIEGFYTEARYYRNRLVYELRCYRADHHGYKPLPVEFLKRPPTVQRDVAPDVDCF